MVPKISLGLCNFWPSLEISAFFNTSLRISSSGELNCKSLRILNIILKTAILKSRIFSTVAISLCKHSLKAEL